MKKGVMAIVICGIALAIGGFVYFVSGVSSTFPPIKQYEFNGNVKQLITGIKSFVSRNSSMKFYLTDTTGNENNGYAYYATLRINDSLEYNLKFEDQDDNILKIDVALIFAYNNINNKGGYSDKAQGIGSIINNFNNCFIKPLSTQQNIQIRLSK
jgi:hypothetical protein